jgi:motility quorum-sensing regulator/GCU-specific mRNA interferase toxin
VTSLTFATIDLGLNDDGIVTLIQSIERTHFFKSMTSLRDHRIWQDVYHLPFESRILYVKFTTDETGYLLISLKDK